MENGRGYCGRVSVWHRKHARLSSGAERCSAGSVPLATRPGQACAGSIFPLCVYLALIAWAVPVLSLAPADVPVDISQHPNDTVRTGAQVPDYSKANANFEKGQQSGL